MNHRLPPFNKYIRDRNISWIQSCSQLNSQLEDGFDFLCMIISFDKKRAVDCSPVNYNSLTRWIFFISVLIFVFFFGCQLKVTFLIQ